MAGNLPILELLQSNPQLMGMLMMGAGQNPQAGAGMADAMGLPTPDTPEWGAMFNPFDSFGHELAGGPPPTMPDVPVTAPSMADPRQMVQTSDVLNAMQPAGMPGAPGASPGATPGGAPAQALQMQQRPLGKITPPTPTKPTYSGGISGAQKAPGMEGDATKDLTATAGLLQALMGQSANRGQIPTLGALLSGR